MGYQHAINAAMVVQWLSPEMVEPVFFTTLPDNVPTLSRFGIAAQYLGFSPPRQAVMKARRLISHPS